MAYDAGKITQAFPADRSFLGFAHSVYLTRTGIEAGRAAHWSALPDPSLGFELLEAQPNQYLTVRESWRLAPLPPPFSPWAKLSPRFLSA